eukprot:s1375_g1.t1
MASSASDPEKEEHGANLQEVLPGHLGHPEKCAAGMGCKYCHLPHHRKAKLPQAMRWKLQDMRAAELEEAGMPRALPSIQKLINIMIEALEAANSSRACSRDLKALQAVLAKMPVAALLGSTLREVRRAALTALSEAAWHWTFWKTYKTLVHAAVCSLLLPAYSLEVGPFLIRIVLWLLLCALPWIPSRSWLAFGTTLPFQYVLLAFALVVIGCFASRGLPCRSQATAIRAAAPLHLRVTGMNAVVLLCIIAEAALLSSVISLRPLLQKEAFFSASAAVTGLWLLVISLPHTQPEGLSAAQDGHPQGVLGSAKFHAAWQLMRRGLALPAAVVLLLHCGAGGALGRWSGGEPKVFKMSVWVRQWLRFGQPTLQPVRSCLLLAFLAFTTALGADMQAHLQSFMPDSLGLDVAQPPTFLAGLTMAQMVFVAQVLYQPDWAWLSMLVSALLPTWVLMFECRQGLAGPAWLLPLQLGASFAPAWSQLAEVLGISSPTRLAGFSTILLLSTIGMELLHRLNRKGVLLSRLASVEFGGSLPFLESYENPRGLASTLEAFEAATRMERLSTEFLVSRKEWLAELREGRDDYAVVARCGSRLVDAVCTPSSTVQTMCLLRRHATRKLPRNIWKMIMSFVSDVRVVSGLLEPVVKHFGGGQPKGQVVRGWEAMNEVGQWLQRQRQATDGDLPESGEDALTKQLAKWWKAAPKKFGRSGSRKAPRWNSSTDNILPEAIPVGFLGGSEHLDAGTSCIDARLPAGDGPMRQWLYQSSGTVNICKFRASIGDLSDLIESVGEFETTYARRCCFFGFGRPMANGAVNGKHHQKVTWDMATATPNVLPVADGRLLMALCDGGLQYVFGGVRATVGAKGGCSMFEITIVELLEPIEGEPRPRAAPASRQLLRVGFSTLEAGVLMDNAAEGQVFVDSLGQLSLPGSKTRVFQRLHRDEVVGLMLNLDQDSPEANTLSIFRNGVRACPPQKLPEGLTTKTLFPTVTFKNMTLLVNFGPTPQCKDVGDEDMEVIESEDFAARKPEVLFPLGLPDHGLFDWVDQFLQENPRIAELSERKAIAWAEKSGIPQGPRRDKSQDRPGTNFGIGALDDGSTHKALAGLGLQLPKLFAGVLLV